jgi:hypothetical protein
MKFDTPLLATDLSVIPQLTRQAEAIGFDGIWVSETAHDAFLPLVLVAEHSQRITLGTSIAVAFPRTPAILAHIAWDNDKGVNMMTQAVSVTSQPISADFSYQPYSLSGCPMYIIP